MRVLYFFLFVFANSLALYSQEFNAQVKVNTPKLQSTDPRTFRTLEEDIRRLINSKSWTNEKYKLHERIKCNFTITIKTEENNNSFTADLTVSAARPVFGSNYETTLLNYIDKRLSFNYLPNDPLNYVPNVFTDKLTAAISFYLYLILGLDADSFAPNGGTDYFLICQNIINYIPSTITGEGWKPSDDAPNRYWLLENILSPRLRSMRGAWYTYHREGLDIMHQSPEDGKKAIVKALEAIDLSKRTYPAAQWLISFMDGKSTELIEIFKVADKPQQQNVYNLLNRIDPTSASRFRILQ
jgi:hypothetical protein